MSLADQVQAMAPKPVTAEDAALALQDDAPTIDLPPDTIVELPGGYIDPSGVLHRTAKVRELTGADEEAVLGLRNVKNPIEYTNLYLDRAVETVGTLPFDPMIRDSLILGDRMSLALGIRRATYGKVMTQPDTCPHCGATIDVHVDLDEDVPVRRLEDPMKRVFSVDLPRGGEATFRLANGGDQFAAYAMSQRLELVNTEILTRCLISVRGTALNDTVDPKAFVRNLNVSDRRAVLDGIAERQPGPQFGEVKVPCAACGETFSPALDWADLLSG